MIINARNLCNILNKINYIQQPNLILSFDEINGFKFKNNTMDLNLLENELNNQYAQEKYLSIKEIAEHLSVSKPTVKKILSEKHINSIFINGEEKILKSDYVSYLLQNFHSSE